MEWILSFFVVLFVFSYVFVFFVSLRFISTSPTRQGVTRKDKGVVAGDSWRLLRTPRTLVPTLHLQW